MRNLNRRNSQVMREEIMQYQSPSIDGNEPSQSPQVQREQEEEEEDKVPSVQELDDYGQYDRSTTGGPMYMKQLTVL